MKTRRFLGKLTRKLVLCALVLGASLTAGCNTFHYFDIQVDFGPVTSEQASQLQFCVLLVSGAETNSSNFPSSVVGLSGDEKSVCPTQGNYPTMGTFEYSTFTDSGELMFAVNGYKSVSTSNDNLCTTGSTSMNASSEITQMGTITMGSFDTTKCPSMIQQP
jgi:hypothetical protein